LYLIFLIFVSNGGFLNTTYLVNPENLIPFYHRHRLLPEI
jgi:hypothetical protein